MLWKQWENNHNSQLLHIGFKGHLLWLLCFCKSNTWSTCMIIKDMFVSIWSANICCYDLQWLPSSNHEVVMKQGWGLLPRLVSASMGQPWYGQGSQFIMDLPTRGNQRDDFPAEFQVERIMFIRDDDQIWSSIMHVGHSHGHNTVHHVY